jgi:hypothetical protein
MATPAGFEATRYLIASKLSGQASIVKGRLADRAAAETIARLRDELELAETLEDIRHVEAVAANVYWNAWSEIEVPFMRKDVPRVADHWRTFEGRRSAVNVGTSRSATDPANALLNYGYRLLEAEGRLACLAVGLDPGLGILHADLKGRDSMVLDVIEAVRPVVDGYVLDLFKARPLTKADFAEDRRGVLRVLPPLTHRIAEAMPTWALALGPVVEHVATVLSTSSPYDVSVPSVLTRDKHKVAAARRVAASTSPAGSGVLSPGPNPGGLAPRSKQRQRPSVATQPLLPRRTCRGCGQVLPALEQDRAATRRWWCDTCRPERRDELDDRMRRAASIAAEQYRAETGVLPSHTDEAQARRRDVNRRRQLARLAWEADHGGESPDVEWYSEQIAPRLEELSLIEIAGALGVSTSSASKFRRGLRIPAPRHWTTLANVLSVDPPTRRPL